MTHFPKRPLDVASPEELVRAETDRPFAAELIMGRLIPFNNHLGFEIVEVSDTHAQLKLPFNKDHVGDPFRPALHGGALATLADSAGGTLVLAATSHEDKVSTLDMRIDYLRPADLVDTFADADLVRIGARAAVVRIQVWQADDREPDGRRHICDTTAVYSVHRG